MVATVEPAVPAAWAVTVAAGTVPQAARPARSALLAEVAATAAPVVLVRRVRLVTPRRVGRRLPVARVRLGLMAR